MERKAHRSGRFLVRLLLLSFAGLVVATLHRERKAVIEPELDAPKRHDRETPDPTPETPAARRRLSTPRRVAVGFALTTIFFAGAAFTAGAGNEVAGLLEQTSTTDTTVTSSSAPDASAVDPSASSIAAPAPDPSAVAPSAPADASSSSSSADDAPATGHGSSTPSAGQPASSTPDSGSAPSSGGSAGSVAPAATPAPAAKPASRPHPAAKRTHARSQWVLSTPHAKQPTGHRHARVATAAQEAAETPGAAPVIWLNRTLPDPTPPSRRLASSFANRLLSVSRANHVSWALVLGVLRAQGRIGAVPANRPELRQTARALAALTGRGDWDAALAVTGRTSTADQAVALEHYNRAVGLSGLVDGLLVHKDDLVNRVLHDGRATIYPGGRQDLASGRVDVRVVVLIEYLADTYGQVTVSCLISGHRLYARPGVISAHIYGRAIDVADLGGIPIYGHQEPGGITERAVRAILLLPSELQPKQVISLLGLGGASFPLADHADHIHIGY